MTNTSVMGTRGVGKAIFKAAFTQLNQEKRVILVPVIGFAANIAVMVGLMVGWLLLIPLMATQANSDTIVNVVLGVLGALSMGVIAVFTQAVVMIIANAQFEGQRLGIGAAFAEAFKHFNNLAIFGMMEATIGILLRALRDERNPIGRFIAMFVSLAWGFVSYFSIPLIVFANAGPFGSVKQSLDLIKSKWGDATRVNIFAGAMFVLAWLSMIALFVGGMYWAIYSGNSYNGDHHVQFTSSIVTMASAILGMFFVGLVQSTVMAYVRVALYRYVTGQKISSFDESLLQRAMSDGSSMPGLIKN